MAASKNISFWWNSRLELCLLLQFPFWFKYTCSIAIIPHCACAWTVQHWLYFPVATSQQEAADTSDQGVLESREEIHGTENNSLFGGWGTALTTDLSLKGFSTLSRERKFLPLYFWHFCESFYFTCCSHLPTADLFPFTSLFNKSLFLPFAIEGCTATWQTAWHQSCACDLGRSDFWLH